MQRTPGLTWYIFFPFFGVALLAFGAMLLLAEKQFTGFFHEETQAQLQRDAMLLQAALLERRTTDNCNASLAQSLCQSWGTILSTRFTVFLPSGQVVADSDLSPDMLDANALRPEVTAALQGQTSKVVRHSTSLDTDMIFVAVPMTTGNGTVQAVIRAARSTEAIRQPLLGLYRQLIMYALLISLAAFLVSVFVARRISAPFRQLQDLARSHAQGETPGTVMRSLPREMEELFESLQQMGGIIAKRFESTRKQKRLLANAVRKSKRVMQELEIANRKLEALASIDGLTGLANRRKFDAFLEEEWTRMLRARKPLAVIMCDVDFFKQFNDTYGHQQGDDCLKAVAACLAWCCRRGTDLAARYGGEEFAVILPDTSGEGAMHLAENIRVTLAARAIPHEQSAVSEQVTVSMGIAILTPTGATQPDQLLEMADQALYAAKHGGRDTIRLHKALDDPELTDLPSTASES